MGRRALQRLTTGNELNGKAHGVGRCSVRSVGTLNRRGRPRMPRMGTDRSEGGRNPCPSVISEASVGGGSGRGRISDVSETHWDHEPPGSRVPSPGVAARRHPLPSDGRGAGGEGGSWVGKVVRESTSGNAGFPARSPPMRDPRSTIHDSRFAIRHSPFASSGVDTTRPRLHGPARFTSPPGSTGAVSGAA